MTAIVLRGDARRLPLPDASVDLIVTSPPLGPYFGLRSYTDDGAHYDGQIGSEATPGEWLAAMVACTAEWVRVLKPSGSIFVNLGDKYSTSMYSHSSVRNVPQADGEWSMTGQRGKPNVQAARQDPVVPPKSLLGLPWRYALACMDQLGLILRRDIIWSKPNGLPESVTDRCRSSHEYLFHFTVQPRYYAAVDEIREPHAGEILSSGARNARYGRPGGILPGKAAGLRSEKENQAAKDDSRSWSKPAIPLNPLGKLPGSVWSIPSQPLTVPAALGVDHFACVDTETEILTPRGWLRHDQLAAGDQVAGYDLDTNTARWTECTAVNRYDYDGDMIAVESRDISMRLTPNHRTIVQRMDAYTKRRNPVSVVRADELGRYHFIPRSAAWRPYGDFYHSGRLAALMGWVAAEGWYQGKGIWLSQSLEVNGPHVAEIDALIPAAAVRTERKRTYKGREWTEVTWKLGAIDAIIQREMPDKLLPWRLVMTTEAERRAALDAFIAGDGHRRPDGRIGIFQKHRHNLDVLQAIAVTLGYKTTLREGGGRFVLYLTEGGRSVTLRGTSGVGSKVRREHYTGTVWCPTTGTGTFIARRNGAVFVTGNSFPMELPRRCVLGWSPPGVCTACGEGRRPVTDKQPEYHRGNGRTGYRRDLKRPNGEGAGKIVTVPEYRDRVAITGYACACPEPDAPVRPALVVDPFGGTGCTALVAAAYGRTGVSVDLSGDYCRLARWRTADPAERARALLVPKPPPVPDGQASLFDDWEAV